MIRDARTTILLTISLTLAISTSSVSAQSSEQRRGETAAQFLAEQRDALTELKKQSPTTPARTIASMIRLDIARGDLVLAPVDMNGADELNFVPDGDEASAFRLTSRPFDARPPAKIVIAHLMRLDEANLRSINIDLVSMPGHVNFSMVIQTPVGTTDAQLVCLTSDADDGQSPETRLYITRAESAEVTDDGRINLVEANFAALVESHHDAALAMLGEALTAIHSTHVLAGIPQADAKSIFIANKPVNGATERALDAIIVELRDHGSAAIPQLRTKLRTLGSPAAMALSRRPRMGWSVDLGVNVDTLTADLFPGGAARAAALLGSPTRLIDLLYAPDIDVRRGATEILQTNPKFKPSFAVDDDPYAHVAEIEALRTRLAPAAN